MQVDFKASCSSPSNLPNPNAAGESYGPDSRCIEHGRTWTRAATRDGLANSDIGVGCYQVSTVNAVYLICHVIYSKLCYTVTLYTNYTIYFVQ